MIAPEDGEESLLLAARLLAVDPIGLGGIVLRGARSGFTDAWLATFRALLPQDAPWRRVPLGIGDARLLGGLDLAATLAAGRPVAETGLLAAADGGVVVLPSAERLSPAVAARIAAVMDTGEIRLERDGLASRAAARFAVVALDEGLRDDEVSPPALNDRLAFTASTDTAGTLPPPPDAGLNGAVAQARRRLPDVTLPDPALEALVQMAEALGVLSARRLLFAARATRAHAALAGRMICDTEDAAVAAALVLAPRATRWPQPEDGAQAAPEPEAADPPDPAPEGAPDRAEGEEKQQSLDPQTLADIILSAAAARLPEGLLLQLRSGTAARAQARAGRAGAQRSTATRGRPIASRPGRLVSGVRLDVVETLRAAAPWQRLRAAGIPGASPQLRIRAEDFRIRRFREKTETATIFVVDASGSQAVNRLAEAKGAVELLLAQCYVRRDEVALMTFRGRGAELVLPPTRSLARAKRSLAAMPGGGGTPLAAAIDAAVALGDAVRRRGRTAHLVFLTDGRANVTREGTGGRQKAEAEALASARAARSSGLGMIVIDTAPRPQAQAARLGAELGALYLPLPQADARRLSAALAGLGPRSG